MVLDVHQCSRCELRFSNSAELRDHFRRDHHANPETFSHYRYTGRSSARPTPAAGRQYLLVANQTLHDEQLLAAIRERAAGGSARFVVLVPATHSANLESPPRDVRGADGPADKTGTGGTAAESDQADDVGLALARWRLRTTIDRLHELGVVAEGHIGHPEPFTAISQALAAESFDEILLSTLPARSSRWLKADLPMRVQRHFRIPVTTLTAAA